MATAKKTTSTKKNLLEGLFFNTFTDDGNLQYHGYVIGEVSPGFLFVQFLDWICNGPTNGAVIPLGSTVGWNFYADAEDCGNDAEQHAKRQVYKDAKVESERRQEFETSKTDRVTA